MPKSYGHTGTILGSKKSRSKSRPHTNVLDYWKQKTEKEQKKKMTKQKKKNERLKKKKNVVKNDGVKKKLLND